MSLRPLEKLSFFSTFALGLQSSALAAAGFPSACGNVITNSTIIGSLYPGESLTAIHYLPDYRQPQCDSGDGLLCKDGYCPGYPTTASTCRLADGITEVKLTVGAGTDPTAYATLCIGISIIAQVSRRRSQRRP